MNPSTRRSLLRLGCLGAVGLALPAPLRAGEETPRFPPYPDVWGLEWPGFSDDLAPLWCNVEIRRGPDGDAAVEFHYRPSLDSFEEKRLILSFFTGERFRDRQELRDRGYGRWIDGRVAPIGAFFDDGRYAVSREEPRDWRCRQSFGAYLKFRHVDRRIERRHMFWRHRKEINSGAHRWDHQSCGEYRRFVYTVESPRWAFYKLDDGSFLAVADFEFFYGGDLLVLRFDSSFVCPFLDRHPDLFVIGDETLAEILSTPGLDSFERRHDAILAYIDAHPKEILP